MIPGLQAAPGLPEVPTIHGLPGGPAMLSQHEVPMFQAPPASSAAKVQLKFRNVADMPKLQIPKEGRHVQLRKWYKAMNNVIGATALGAEDGWALIVADAEEAYNKREKLQLDEASAVRPSKSWKQDDMAMQLESYVRPYVYKTMPDRSSSCWKTLAATTVVT